MIEQGANPFIVAGNDIDEFSNWNLAKLSLSNLPTKKSVFFTIRPFIGDKKDKDVFLDPWFYRTGVFGTFDSVIGQGASGIVLSGDWFGRKAAFKFVEIGAQNMPQSNDIKDGLKVLNGKISEMTSIKETEGSKIVSFYGHYR